MGTAQISAVRVTRVTASPHEVLGASAESVAKVGPSLSLSQAEWSVKSRAASRSTFEAAKQRKRMRDLAIFLILRYTGMRRESVATLRVRNIDAN